MISYTVDRYHLAYILSSRGSTIPKAFGYSIPSAALAVGWRAYLNTASEHVAATSAAGESIIWSSLTMVLVFMIGFRVNKSYARFWEGITLVQQMSGEWFESASHIVAFVDCDNLDSNPDKMEKVLHFQGRLVRLFSLIHALALRQIGGDEEDFAMIDVHGLDHESMLYLYETCEKGCVNRVEVALHWVLVLITNNELLNVAPPILSRAYQTLSRGMVHLNNARKIQDVPFPFALSQMFVVLLLIHSVLTPLFMGTLVDSYLLCGVATMLPLTALWSLTFIAGQMEQPFGSDTNDLPLAKCQQSFNTSILMLLDRHSTTPPELAEHAVMTLREMQCTAVHHWSDKKLLERAKCKEALGTGMMRRKQQSIVGIFGNIRATDLQRAFARSNSHMSQNGFADSTTDRDFAVQRQITNNGESSFLAAYFEPPRAIAKFVEGHRDSMLARESVQSTESVLREAPQGGTATTPGGCHAMGSIKEETDDARVPVEFLRQQICSSSSSSSRGESDTQAFEVDEPAGSVKPWPVELPRGSIFESDSEFGI